jgi:FSR family fosmidomycin resistance protein-like MFS transporter
MMEKTPLALFILVHVVDDLYMGAVPALLPFLVAERHYSYLAATGITLAVTFLSSVLQPLFGLLADRHNLNWLAGAGVLVAGVGFGCAGLGHSCAATWIAIAVCGVGVAAYHPEASRAARAAADGTARGMSWFSVGGNVGTAMWAVIVVPVLATTGLYGTTYIGLPGLLTGAAFLAVVLIAGRRLGRVSRAPKVVAGARDD